VEKRNFFQAKKRHVSGIAYMPLSFCLHAAHFAAYIAAYIQPLETIFAPLLFPSGLSIWWREKRSVTGFSEFLSDF